MPKNIVSKAFSPTLGPDGRWYTAPSGGSFSDPSLMGPYSYAFYDSGFSTTGISAGRIYYPVGLTAVRPCTILCGGFQNDIFQAVDRISGFVDADNFEFGILLASHGFPSFHINPPGSLDGPVARATAISNAATSLAAENTRVDSPLFGLIDTTKMMAMGHSFGGGGAFKAPALNSSIKAVMGLQPVFDGTGYPTTLSVPGLIFSANGDGTDNYQSVYDAIPSTTAKIIAKHDANQYSGAHDAGRAITSQYVVSDGGGLGGAHTQDAIMRQLIVAFAQYYLLGLTAYKPYLATGTGLTSFTFNDV